MTGPMKQKNHQHDENLTEEEKRKLQSQQDKENQRRDDHRRPDATHGNHSQNDKQIAPEQRGKDDQ